VRYDPATSRWLRVGAFAYYQRLRDGRIARYDVRSVSEALGRVADEIGSSE